MLRKYSLVYGFYRDHAIVAIAAIQSMDLTASYRKILLSLLPPRLSHHCLITVCPATIHRPIIVLPITARPNTVRRPVTVTVRANVIFRQLFL